MSRGQTGHITGQMGRVPGTDGTHTRGCPAKILYVYWFCSFPKIGRNRVPGHPEKLGVKSVKYIEIPALLTPPAYFTPHLSGWPGTLFFTNFNYYACRPCSTKRKTQCLSSLRVQENYKSKHRSIQIGYREMFFWGNTFPSTDTESSCQTNYFHYRDSCGNFSS